jgi:type I restriction enzyme M protein
LVLDTGAVTRGSGSKNEDKERNIRKWFVDRDLVEGVILMPDNLFYNTTAAGVIVVLNKRKPESKKGKITLVNASKRFTKGKPKNHLADDDVADLARLFNSGESVEGEVAVIDTSHAAGADYNLSPSRWVSAADAADHRDISELVAELEALAVDAAKNDGALFALLKGI